MVATLIVLTCLQGEKKKFKKRLRTADSKDDLVRDVAKLDSIMARYVQQLLGLGVLEKLASSYANDKQDNKIEIIRFDKFVQPFFSTLISQVRSKAMVCNKGGGAKWNEVE